jgi:hypothetical protein
MVLALRCILAVAIGIATVLRLKIGLIFASKRADIPHPALHRHIVTDAFKMDQPNQT